MLCACRAVRKQFECPGGQQSALRRRRCATCALPLLFSLIAFYSLAYSLALGLNSDDKSFRKTAGNTLSYTSFACPEKPLKSGFFDPPPERQGKGSFLLFNKQAIAKKKCIIFFVSYCKTASISHRLFSGQYLGVGKCWVFGLCLRTTRHFQRAERNGCVCPGNHQGRSHLMIDVAYAPCPGNVAPLRRCEILTISHIASRRGAQTGHHIGFFTQRRNGATPIRRKPSVGRNVPARGPIRASKVDQRAAEKIACLSKHGTY